MQVEWPQIKDMIVSRGLSAQWVVVGENYWIKAFDGSFELECLISTDEAASADTADFVANFKSNGNKSPRQSLSVSSTPAFASKSFGAKALFKRVVGKQFALTTGDNILLYTETFPWVKFMALEIINGEVGDTCSLYVLDTENGTYSTVPNYPLNQFGYAANIAAGFYQHKSEFDADVYAGLQLKIVYTSVSAKTVGINYVMNEVK
jgi:hypothetical protein